MSWLKKLTEGLKKTSSSAKSKLSGIFIGKKIDADTMESLEEALISSDLGVSASQKIVKEFEKNYSGKTSDQEELLEALSKSISNILEPLEKELIVSDDHHPHIMMLVGVNGSGKTTTAGKLAKRFSQQGKKVILVAADTFRAAAIEQLKGWAEKTSVELISAERGADPAALVYQSIEKAKKNNSENIQTTDFKVGNCEDTKLNSEQFDLVYGSAILHHLEFKKSLDEIYRLLKVDGSLVFIEPMATNPFINFYRFLTPKSRSHDEHPLTNKDLDYIKSKFKDCKVQYYGFFTLVFILFYKSPESKIFKFLKKIDHIFLNNNFFKGLAWTVIITAKKN